MRSNRAGTKLLADHARQAPPGESGHPEQPADKTGRDDEIFNETLAQAGFRLATHSQIGQGASVHVLELYAGSACVLSSNERDERGQIAQPPQLAQLAQPGVASVRSPELRLTFYPPGDAAQEQTVLITRIAEGWHVQGAATEAGNADMVRELARTIAQALTVRLGRSAGPMLAQQPAP